MNSQQEASSGWTPCEPGRLQELSRRLQCESSACVVRRAAIALSLSAAAVLLVGLAFNFRTEAAPAAIACQEVGQHLVAYARGDCAPELHDRIERHLQRCPRCVKHLEEVRQANALAAPAGRLALLGAAWSDAGRSRPAR
ncbi:hypothetical protein Pla123a_20080 [Posidoniimonas polymericola]|uniref:Putative zinc-finger domain-containing protein n=1 Tax=Posidoniimonas polymericola TaxID=2528002 RepID=A0A5C5YRI4_9BACT|nr:zf-HC2 domain-containing protein [Posidoniimonas polymericola]TWT77347.1 hypothetical protein Pla123a_20080 [Posidoniimonas polymericola]